MSKPWNDQAKRKARQAELDTAFAMAQFYAGLKYGINLTPAIDYVAARVIFTRSRNRVVHAGAISSGTKSHTIDYRIVWVEGEPTEILQERIDQLAKDLHLVSG